MLTVTFLLTEGRLLSIRTDELAAFRLFRMRARMQADFVHSAEDILLAIYDVAVEYAPMCSKACTQASTRSAAAC